MVYVIHVMTTIILLHNMKYMMYKLHDYYDLS